MCVMVDQREALAVTTRLTDTVYLVMQRMPLVIGTAAWSTAPPSPPCPGCPAREIFILEYGFYLKD